jgi:lipopolysaccharide export system permease protein
VLDTTLTPERLIARILTPERMSLLDLTDYISYLKENQLQTERQVVALWRKMAYPFTLLVMITIAAPIGFMQTRRGGVGSKVFIGILLGVGFFMLNQLALNVGMLSKWAPWVTALVPNLGALALGLGALILMENQHNVRRFGRSQTPWSAPAA